MPTGSNYTLGLLQILCRRIPTALANSDAETLKLKFANAERPTNPETHASLRLRAKARDKKLQLLPKVLFQSIRSPRSVRVLEGGCGVLESARAQNTSQIPKSSNPSEPPL